MKKKALFTDPIFSEGFGIMILLDEGFCERKKNGVVILMHTAYQIFFMSA